MPNMFGGDQLGPEYDPVGATQGRRRRTKTEAGIRDCIRSLRRELESIDRAAERLKAKRTKAESAIAAAQKKCAHGEKRGVTMPYGGSGTECVLCGHRER